jgi:hypothetical protein
MAGSLSMATTAVSLPKVAVVDSGEVGRSAVYSRHNNGPRTLLWGTPALTGAVGNDVQPIAMLYIYIYSREEWEKLVVGRSPARHCCELPPGNDE